MSEQSFSSKLEKYKYKPDIEEIEYICSRYDIGRLLHISDELAGSSNTNVKVITEKGCFVLRFFYAPAERIDYINTVLFKLKNAGLPVVMPVMNDSGAYYMHINTDMAVQLTEFIYAHEFNYSPRHYYNSGRMLRQLHDALTDMQSGPMPGASIYPSSKSLMDGLEKLREFSRTITPEQINMVESICDQLDNNWSELTAHLPRTVIHGDWSPSNQLYDSKDNICGILDFDFIQEAERVHDVAYLIWFSYMKKYDKRPIRHFIQGYGGLTQEEKSIIPIFFARMSLFFICTSILTPEPEEHFSYQFGKQLPHIAWIQSGKGVEELKYLCS